MSIAQVDSGSLLQRMLAAHYRSIAQIIGVDMNGCNILDVYGYPFTRAKALKRKTNTLVITDYLNRLNNLSQSGILPRNSYVSCPVDELPKGKFDLIVMGEKFPNGYERHLENGLKNAKQLLANDGSLVVIVPNSVSPVGTDQQNLSSFLTTPHEKISEVQTVTTPIYFRADNVSLFQSFLSDRFDVDANQSSCQSFFEKHERNGSVCIAYSQNLLFFKAPNTASSATCKVY